MRGTVLVVDDQGRPRQALANELEDAGFRVVQATDGQSAWRKFCDHQPDVVVTDMVMPRSDGLELLQRIRSQSEVPVIMFTAQGSIESAVSAVKGGAAEFVSSADVDVEDLVGLVSKAIEPKQNGAEPSGLEILLPGDSPEAERLRQRVAGLAPLWTPVLICGERGSGRDTVARALHQLGVTGAGRLVRIDAARASGDATASDAAAVYLDGIERLSEEADQYWVRVLGSIERGTRKSRLRLLASTTESIPLGFAGASKRRGLLSGLARFTIELSPLRDRPEDIPVVAASMVSRIGEEVGRKEIRLTPSALNFLRSRRWPGNFRQLENVLGRCVAFTRGRQLRKGVVEEILADSEETVASIRREADAQERTALIDAIRETGGNVTHTAEILGRSRSAVYRLIEKHGIPLRRGG